MRYPYNKIWFRSKMRQIAMCSNMNESRNFCEWSMPEKMVYYIILLTRSSRTNKIQSNYRNLISNYLRQEFRGDWLQKIRRELLVVMKCSLRPSLHGCIHLVNLSRCTLKWLYFIVYFIVYLMALGMLYKFYMYKVDF